MSKLPHSASDYIRFQKNWVSKNGVRVGMYVLPDEPETELIYNVYGFQCDITDQMSDRIRKRCAMEIMDIADEGITLSDGCIYPYFILGLWNKEIEEFSPSIWRSITEASIQDPELEYTKCEKDWIKRNHVTYGSIVIATNPAKSHENGWDNTWVSEMVTDELLMVVEYPRNLRIRTGTGIECQDGKGKIYRYPYFVLEFVH